MNIENILVVSPKYRELQELIEQNQVDKNFRFLPEEEMKDELLEWADAFVAFNTKQDYDYSKVKWVHSLGAGVDRYVFKKQWDENVLLTRTICSFGQRIGEFCLSYLLMDLQYHVQFRKQMEQKNWQPITPKLLSDQKVVIFGTGEIGQKTAEILSNLSVQVFGVSLSGKEKEYFQAVYSVDQELPILQNADYVINTLPLTEKTERLFDETIFHQLSNAGFINVGRGASVDEDALLKALNTQHVRFAVLDVFKEEPLPTENPLWTHPSVLITPHISAVTTPVEAVECFVETLRNVEENKPLRNQVDIVKGF
ncbi:D-2-hydroxyacid dehydrogenase [Anaerobacillus alkaliphilus]|uniref:D-2-hydroxyacid dehydrogenase n=1 Tax=Anaerobacillus alkaliphilus TaxID=1548597 RepID=A0A4Q0VP57_9BACI|nr:D-2-hydroxyacid dehydrogenase [Anaerobacillus alkaliphilus]RXI96652.1 D-2-hydroxyacid dehydrogenase [Anaerobacillus alkaliphilus]